MSRRYSSDRLADDIGDMVFNGVLVAGVIAVMAGIAIAELFRTPTEDKLRRLAPQEAWGALITGKPCPHCRTSTEAQAGYCYSCGHRLL
jgi:hypothetical protein